jgi:ADP-ribose pyrophosphatase YjhB (NUDIX family)
MSETFSVVQKAFITNSRWQVLITKHPLSTDAQALWDLPGGHLKFGQSLRDSFVSKVQSETGLTLSTVSIPLNVTTYLDLIDRSVQVIRITYLCIAQGSIADAQKNKFLWIDANDHNHYPFPDEGYTQAFQNYLSHSRLSSEEFLGPGILSHTLIYLKQRSTSPFPMPDSPLD